jgi:hypothetical protein
MKIFFAFIFFSLSFISFLVALTSMKSAGDSFSIGYNIGAHLPWILFGFLGYRLLKKGGGKSAKSQDTDDG